LALPKPLHRLVPTKLAAPRPLFSWVARERLFALLGSRPATPLTLVVAPAGFGKSTLVAQWLLGAHRVAHETQRAERPAAVAWLMLDEHDQDGLTVLTYIAGAIERALPGTLPASLSQIEAGAPLHIVLQALLVDLSALQPQLTIVLDDYHLIEAESVHHSVGYLLRNLPPQCHMVIVSRIDPPLSLARLRATQQVRELRAADLRFTLEETAALLAALSEAPPEGRQVEEIHRQTEGWAIALQLSALANPEHPARGGRLGLAQREIAEYLADEVLARQPDAVQTTLLTLAVPERFCAELLAALLGTPDDTLAAESRIDQLLRANLFVVQLDPERRWFRLHQLFRELLLRRLQLARGAGGVRELHQLSARWFVAAGRTEEALGHLLTAGDAQEAAALVERLLPLEGTRSGSNSRLDYWLHKLPAALTARLPGLALIRAHLAGVKLDLEDMAAALAQVDALLAGDAAPPPWPTFHADLAAIRGVLFYWQGRPEAAGIISQALEQPMMPTLAGRSFLFHGLAIVGLGRHAEDAERVKDALPAALSVPEPEQPTYRRAYLSGMYLLAGEFDLLLQEERQAALRAAPVSDTLAAYVALCSGIAAYERAEYQLAAAQFNLAAAHKYRANAPTYMSAIVGLALIALAEGSLETAQGYVQEAATTAEEAGGPFLRHQALALSVRIALARGDTSAAVRLVPRITADIDLGGSIWLEAPRLTQARALIAAGEAGDLALAEELVASCLREIEPRHNRYLLVRALATRALLRQAQGRHAEARADLRQAVALGAPRGFVRSFLDLGPALLPPLRELAAAGVVVGPLAKALVAGPPAPHPITAPPAALPEMLTPRESQILTLLAERWSDKEIAERLVIAPNTVRKHTGTIYEKLGVSSRREAVDVAISLGLLPRT
jgi:LuxR family maltose regulon positive regulatory protein